MKRLARHCRLALALALLLPMFAIPLMADSASETQKEKELLENTKEVAEGKLSMKGPMHDEWLVAAWQFTKKHTLAAWEWLVTHVNNVLDEDFQIHETSLVATIILILVLTAMFLSGAWAASIAQSRRHPRLPFFLLGFFTFFVGPAMLLYNLDIKGEKEMLERLAEESAAKKAEAEERERRVKEGLAEKGEIQEPAVSADGVVWDQNYFNSIQRKEDGTPDGPWNVAYNGIHVKVLEILEVLPNVVAVRLVNQEGVELKGRIPFAKIEQWDRA